MNTWLHELTRKRSKHTAQTQEWGTIARLLCLCAVLTTSPSFADKGNSEQTTFAAVASSFRELWPELSEQFMLDTGSSRPKASFGSSGLLATQISHGAPFELFLSADRATVEKLHAAKLTQDNGKTLALGTLTLVKHISLSKQGEASATLGTAQIVSLQTLAELLNQNEPFRLAIPNPRHAPYGVAAREALQSAELWPFPQERLLNAENAAQTLQFVRSGAVDYAIVPDTLLHHIPNTLLVAPLPTDSYQPVEHRIVRLQGAGQTADAFYEWAQSSAATKILSRYNLAPVN